MKKIKRIINGLIALAVAQTPLLFPEEGLMLAVFIIGLATIAVFTYCILEFITSIIGGRNNG